MALAELSGAQRRYLRALGHHLEPVIRIGQRGVQDGVVSELARALEAHELVKLKFGQNVELDRDQTAEQLAREAGAHLVQVIGRVALLYRPAARPEDRRIQLPRIRRRASNEP